MTFEAWWEHVFKALEFGLTKDHMKEAFLYGQVVKSWEGFVDRQGGAFDETDTFYDEWKNSK